MTSFKVRLCRLMAAFRVGVVLPLDSLVRVYGGTDKRTHGYVPYYEAHLRRLRLHTNRVLEIGVGRYESSEPGGSLRVWRDYFPRSQIVGLDLFDKDVALGRRVRFVKGDQADTETLDRVIGALAGPPNIVIDDGSHMVGHAETTFRHLFPLMPSGSVYVIEDLHTSYWPHFGGGIPTPPGTAIEFLRLLMDSVQHADGTFDRVASSSPRPRLDVADVGSLHVFPGIAFIIKR